MSEHNNASFDLQLLTKSADVCMVMIVQSGEAVDMTEFSDKIQRPMMEMKAGSNVWYQAHIQDSNRKKLLVLFPGDPFDKKHRLGSLIDNLRALVDVLCKSFHTTAAVNGAASHQVDQS